MGFYSSASDLAKAIQGFKKKMDGGGLPGREELLKFRKYYDQLPKKEREAFRMNYPSEYRFWVKAAPQKKPAFGKQVDLELDDDRRDLTKGRAEREIELAKVHREQFTADVRAVVQGGVFDMGELVSGEDIRLTCEERGIHPHDPHAWGGVVMGMVRAEILGKTDQRVPCTDPKIHARDTPLWRVLVVFHQDQAALVDA